MTWNKNLWHEGDLEALPQSWRGDFALMPKQDFDRIMNVLKQNQLTLEVAGVEVIPIRFPDPS